MQSRKEYFTLERQGQKPGACEPGGVCCACLLFLGILLLITGAVILLIFLILLAAEPGPQVDTPCGPIHGSYSARDKAMVYRGVPYAKPPVGELRWRDAEELTPSEDEEGEAGQCWEGTLQARTNARQCIQAARELRDNDTSIAVSGAEDCLYMNIYVPDLKFSEKYQKRMEEEKAEKEKNNQTSSENGGEEENKNASIPIMVYINGGNTEKPYRPPGKLAEELGVILVVPQYRTGALGFMVLDGFDSDQKGNYGISDIIAALKWIKSNIESFGGDPEKVTIFGAGKGGTAVWGLLTSPNARDLFSSAWVMSGSANIRQEMAEAAKDNQYVWDVTDCDSAACLRNLTAENITTVYEEGRQQNLYNGFPVVGEKTVTDYVVFGNLGNPLEDLKSGATGISDVPLIIGSAAQSIDLNPAPGADLQNWDNTTLLPHLEERFQDFGTGIAEKALEVYEFNMTCPEYQYTTMVSDIRFVCQQEAMAEAASNSLSKPVYRYVMRNSPSSPAKFGDITANYAFQGWDLLSLFDSLGGFLEGGTNEEDEKLREALINSIYSFIHKGEMEMPWGEFPGSTAHLSNDLAISSKRYNEDQCQFWKDLALQDYAAAH